VELLARFIGEGTRTLSPEGIDAFTKLCFLMRSEAHQERSNLKDIVGGSFWPSPARLRASKHDCGTFRRKKPPGQ
jgi:hypothetical protein